MRETESDSVGLAEREAQTRARVIVLRRMQREFAVLRTMNERLASDVEEFGKALERLEDADPDAP